MNLDNPEDLRNSVGDFCAQKVMQIPNIETVFESELIWNFLYHALPNLLFNVNFLGHLEELNVVKHTVLLLSDLVSENRVRFAQSIKKKSFTFFKNRSKNDISISISKFFFQKKFYAWNCLIRKDHRFFFRFAKIVQFFVVAPHQQIFEIFEKVEFLQGHEELNIVNGTVIFSERPSFQKANNFLNLT